MTGRAFDQFFREPTQLTVGLGLARLGGDPCKASFISICSGTDGSSFKDGKPSEPGCSSELLPFARV